MSLVLAVVFVPTIAVQFCSKIFWPYARYDMFADNEEESFRYVYLQGVTSQNQIFHITGLSLDIFQVDIRRIVHRRVTPTQASALAEMFFNSYERRRIENKHSAPAIKELRIYELTLPVPDTFHGYLPPTEKTLLGTYRKDL